MSHAAERNEPAVGDRHLQGANGVQIAAHLGRTPDDDVEEPLILVELADLRALHERRRRPPDLSRVRPNAAARSGSKRTSIFGTTTCAWTVRSATPLTLATAARTACPVHAELVELGAVDANDDRRAGAGQHLLDSFAKIGQEVAVQPGIAVDDRLQSRHRGLVVHGRVEADPQLGEVRSDDLVGHLGAADVRPEILDAGHRHQLAARALGDAPHGIERRAGLFHPVHQEVVLAEARAGTPRRETGPPRR